MGICAYLTAQTLIGIGMTQCSAIMQPACTVKAAGNRRVSTTAAMLDGRRFGEVMVMYAWDTLYCDGVGEFSQMHAHSQCDPRII